ncbi:MAG: hypothetical protein H6Q33_1073 [Deltaproteobacteria bacterium]|jgi:hypothetical protein|nr:hypothetical protein [Deltaproteobacteria bacterium]
MIGAFLIAFPDGLRYQNGLVSHESMKMPNSMCLKLRPFVRAERVAPTSSGEPLAAHDLD